MSHGHVSAKKHTQKQIILVIVIALLAALLFFVNKQVASQNQTSIYNGFRSISPEPFAVPKAISPEPFRPQGISPDPFIKPRGISPEPFRSSSSNFR